MALTAGGVLAHLDSYRPEGGEEAVSLARIREFLGGSPSPFGRGNPEGHITGSAVVARPGGEAFLLVYHRRLGRWLQPGGYTDPANGSVFATAAREAREETGLRSFQAPLGERLLDLDVHAIPAREGEPAHWHFDLRYLLTSEEASPAALEDEAERASWFSLEEALLAGVDRSLERALRKARACLAPSER